MKATLKNENTGMIKQVGVGVNIPMIFFGLFTPLFKLDFKYFFIMFAVDIALAMMFPAAIFGFTIGMAMAYNQFYIRDLIKKGYLPADSISEDILKSKNIYFNK